MPPEADPADLLGHGDELDAAAPVAAVEDATRRYTTRTSTVIALDGVTADVPRGSLTAIAGPSGSGKSTLLALLGCIDRPDAGHVWFEGLRLDDLSRRERRDVRRRRLGIVLPLPSDNLLERLDAAGNIAWAARVRSGASAASAHVAEALSAVGLGDSAGKRVRQLSGGEQQRLALACALIGAPGMVVADEPTASLDRASSAGVVAAMRRAADSGVTLVVASHDHQVMDASDHLVRLDHGRRVA